MKSLDKRNVCWYPELMPNCIMLLFKNIKECFFIFHSFFDSTVRLMEEFLPHLFHHTNLLHPIGGLHPS